MCAFAPGKLKGLSDHSGNMADSFINPLSASALLVIELNHLVLVFSPLLPIDTRDS